MKNKVKSSLLALGLGLAALVSATGCATVSRAPTIVKGVLTPLALARDLADIPASGAASIIDDFADNFYDSGPINSTRFSSQPYPYMYGPYPGRPFMGGYPYYNSYSSYDGNNVGNAAPLFGGIIRAAGFCFAAPDYILCRSFTPDWKGTSPYKKTHQDWSEHFWKNTKTLWQKPEEAVKKK